MSYGFERRIANDVSRETARQSRLEAASQARVAGYTGAICDVCGSPRMKMAGHCMVCEDCGTSTGCS